jgi:hypothetical protein
MDLYSLFQVGVDILTTTVSKATNKILAQTGHVVGEVTDADNVEWWQHYGFFSRPPKSQKGKQAAQAIVMRRPERDVAFASQDLRGLELYGNADHGEAGIYSAGEDGNGQARVLCKKDGSINCYTTHDNTASGRSVCLRIAPDGLTFTSPWGSLRFDRTGFHVNTASGASFNLGGMAGLPAPFDTFGSYARVNADVVQTSSKVSTSGGAGGSSLASAQPVMQAITALQVEVAAIAAALVAVANISGPIGPSGTGPHAVAAQAATAAVGVAAGVLLTATPTIPTTTTSS